MFLAFTGSASAQTAAKGDAAKGKVVFENAKPACKTCHTAAKNQLTGLSGKTNEELQAWIRTPKEMMAKENKKGLMPAYASAKISDADLADLVAYIKSLK